MDHQKILERFERDMQDFATDGTDQRDEIRNAYLYYGCYQRLYNDERKKDRLKANVALIPAIINAVSGSEIMRQRKVDIVAIEDNPTYNSEADIMADVVGYAQYISGSRETQSQARKDALICGIGATVKNLDMTNREMMSGVPDSRRIYPGFLIYDRAARGNDLNKVGNFCGYADPMRHRDLEEYIAQKHGKKEVHIAPGAGGGYYMDLFIKNHLDESQQDFGMLYHYFWRDLVTVRDTINPFADDEEGNPSRLKQALLADPMALEIMSEWTGEAQVDITAPYWTLDADEYKELEETIAAVVALTGEDIALQATPRQVRCYYRAEIALGQVLEASKSYSQQEFPLNFMTGYYDEPHCRYYGLVRPLSMIQDALNIVLDDLLEFSYEAITGGKSYVKGMADDIKAIKKAREAGDRDIPIPPDGEVTPVALASSPQVLLETARLFLELMPRSIGLGQEFFGVISSGTMTDSLYGRVVRQSFAVLEDFANSSSAYCRRDAQLDMDMMRGVAKAENGRILPILSPGKNKQDYIRLTLDSIARQYVIRVVERPVTEDEEQQSLRVLMQLVESGAMQSPLLPTIIRKLPIDQQEKDQLIEQVTPKPQQPDPMSIESVKANIRLLNAQAAELEAKAADKAGMMPVQVAKTESETARNTAQAAKSYSDIDNNIAGILKMMNELGQGNDRYADRYAG